jgi:hypothetical protein
MDVPGAMLLLITLTGCGGPGAAGSDGGMAGKGIAGMGVAGTGYPAGGRTGEGGAGVGGATGCVDIVISSRDLPDDSTGIPVSLSGGVWRNDFGLHVAWKAYVGVAPTYRPWLFLSTFDPSNGAVIKRGRFDILPADATSSDSNIQGAAGAPTGPFAASFRSYDKVLQKSRNEDLLIGNVGDDLGRITVDLGWSSGAGDVTDIGWDGDAFAVHSRDNATGDVFVTRVAPSGEVVLPLTRYGTTPSPGGTPLGYRMSTSSDSGMSHLFDAPGTGRYLSGHDRSGNPLPWAAPMPLNLLIPDVAMADSAAFRPGVGADADGGLWAAWVTYNSGGGFVRAAAHVTLAGDADQFFMLPVSSGQKAAAVGVESATKVWIADSDSVDILLAEFDRGDLAPVRPLVVGPFALNSGQVWQPDYLTAVVWRGERWLAFMEQSVLLHIVKVQDGCTYAAAFRPTQAEASPVEGLNTAR